MAEKEKRCFWSLLILGLFLAILGAVLIYGFGLIIKNKIKSEEVISNGSDVYNNWIVPPAPVTMQFYIFNIANPDELKKNPKAKINLEQLGPYTYQEHRKKVDINFSSDGEKVSYREIRYFQFSPGDSGIRRESDKVWMLNIGLVGVSQVLDQVLHKYPSIVERLAALLVKLGGDGDLFIQRTVGELIWGYKDPLLSKLKPLIKVATGKDFDDHIGLFYGKNNSDDGHYEIFTGKRHSDKFGVINQWNGVSVLSYWEDRYSNTINGSDGTLFPPFVEKDRTLYFFSTDICRSIYATYEKTISLLGVTLYHYIPPPDVFLTASENLNNRGFCTPDTQHCLPSGTLNLTVCQQGQPAVASLPHFYQGDENLRLRFNGLRPRKEEHQTYIDVEPHTGVPMNVAKRLQVNLYLQPVKYFPSLKDWEPLIFPLMWINESASLTDSLATDFKNQVYKPMKLTAIVQYVLIGIGALLVVVALLLGLSILGKRKAAQDPNGDQSGLVPGEHEAEDDQPINS